MAPDICSNASLTPLPPKEPDASGRLPRRSKPGRPIRRLVIWYRRNAAVTSLVGTATSAVNTAGTVAGAATSVAGSMANTVLQPLVFDPLRRLQGSGNGPLEINDAERLWVAVDGMGGDYAPGPILEGCLQAVLLLPVRVRFVAEAEPLRQAVAEMGLQEQLNDALARGLIAAPAPSRPGQARPGHRRVFRR